MLLTGKHLQHPVIKALLLLSGLLVAGELISIVTFALMAFHQWPLPWSFINILIIGYYLPVIMAFFIFIISGFIVYCFYKKGCFQWYGTLTLKCCAFCFIGLWLGLILFKYWGGPVAFPYPWQTWLIFQEAAQQAGLLNKLIISLIIPFIGLFVLTVLSFLKKHDKRLHIHGNAHFATQKEIQKAGLLSKKGLVLGTAYRQCLKLDGNEGMLVTAPTGAGKTAAIAIPNLLEWPDSGVFNDLKGELYQKTARHRETVLQNKCFCWAPANPGGSLHSYNPFFYVNKNPDLRVRDLQLIAEIIIPAERIDGGFWYTSSREIFLLLAAYLFESSGIATLGEIHDLSKQPDFITWLECVLHEGKIKEKLFVQNAQSLVDTEEKTQKNILKDFHSRMSLFSDPMIRRATENNSFDLRKLRQEKMSVFLNIPEADKHRLKPILTLFWAQLINLLTQEEPDPIKEPLQVLALLDEFGNMAKIDKLRAGVSFLRSYHVRTVIMVQYLSQIVSIYGHHDAKGFLNSKVKIAFTLNDYDDAIYFSKCLGNKTIKVQSRGATTSNRSSRSTNISLQSKPLMAPDELMKLPYKKMLILLEGHQPILAKKTLLV